MTTPTDPAGRALHQWQDITRFMPVDPAARARIERAEELADQTIAGAVLAGWMRDLSRAPNPGGQLDAAMVWSQLALMWHQVLTDTDTYRHVRSATPTPCRIDQQAIREWLARSDGESTIGARLLGDEFGLGGFYNWGRISDLLAEAQDAAIFGIDGQRIDILHIAGRRGFVERHRVTLTAPQHGTVCSADIDTIELLTTHLTGTDAAVHLLATVAAEVNQLVTQRAMLADLPPPAPQADRTEAAAPVNPRSVDAAATPPLPTVDEPSAAETSTVRTGRAFRPLAADTIPAHAGNPAIDTPAQPRAGRRRR